MFATRTENLIESWEIAHSNPCADVPEGEWIPAVVPGGVHESLIAAGQLEHPYRDQHEADARWIEDRSWWYRAELEIPSCSEDEAIVLRFDGLDTVATIWLNGEEVAHHANQFRPLELDVTDREGGVEVLIRFDPPLWNIEEPKGPRATRNRMLAYFAQQGAMVGETGDEPLSDLRFTLRRKGVYSWGWDFAPRVPSIGLIGPVRLVKLPSRHIDSVRFRTLELGLDGSAARVEIESSFNGPVEGCNVEWQLCDPSGQKVAGDAIENIDGDCLTTVEIPDAQLWWTHDLGEPALYTLSVKLVGSDGNLLDQVDERVGIRTITVDTSPDNEDGRSMAFILNGVRIVARGANWVPSTMLPGSVKPGDLRASVQMAVEAQMNMLRIWGGGVYEAAAFHDACDELGVLVWQDFMFTSVDYPDEDPELREEVREEVSWQIRRLRNHASTALWAGNNEASAMHRAIWGTDEPSGWGDYFYDHLMPELVAKLDPGATFWRGSPHGTLDSINGVRDGDRHAWEVWHGANLGTGGPQEFSDPGEQVHFWRYQYDNGRFISEFGIQAAPELSTLREWTDEDLTLNSPAWLHRIKDRPKDKGVALLATETGLPETVEGYITASMMVQAEGLAFGIEHYRRRQPICSGMLLWQWNEPWPGLSWSVTDYNGVPKAAWYRLRNSYAPVLLSLKHNQQEDIIEAWITNSSREDWQGGVEVQLLAFPGMPKTTETFADLVVPAGESHCVGALRAPEDKSSMFVRARDISGELPANRLFFDHVKNLPLDGTVDFDVVADETMRSEGRATVKIRAKGYAYAVRVVRTGSSERHSDAYFDLADGEEINVEVTGLEPGFDPSSIQVETWADQK